MIDLHYPRPPVTSIADGATTPVPSVGSGAFAYSTVTGSLIQWNGSQWRAVGNNQRASCHISSNLADNTSTTLSDAAGLSFALRSGYTYRFGFHVVFQSAATGTGIQLALNGPAFSMLSFNTDIPISATARVIHNRRAYNVTANPGTGVDVANSDLLALIEGSITPSADGTLIVRQASEVAASAIRIRAGSSGWCDVANNSIGAFFDTALLASRSIGSGTFTDSPILSDHGREVRSLSNTSEVVVTLPLDLPGGFITTYAQGGTAQCRFVAGTGVTAVNTRLSPTNVRTSGKTSRVTVQRVHGTTEWDVFGEVE